ncbi:MAG TPA: hypothetical protein PLP29_17785, partial [Candidatus Ozemobacteraceae bacterium]|nr:hypothetical protein [Candidatus Ozemobacteraceae bacterium]
MKYGCIVIAIITLLGLVGGGWYWYKQQNAPPTWNFEEVTEGEIRQTISATGSLAAQTGTVREAGLRWANPFFAQ